MTKYVLGIQKSGDGYIVQVGTQSPKGKVTFKPSRDLLEDSPEDAVFTLRDRITEMLGTGKSFRIKDKFTLDLVNRYASSRREN